VSTIVFGSVGGVYWLGFTGGLARAKQSQSIAKQGFPSDLAHQLFDELDLPMRGHRRLTIVCYKVRHGPIVVAVVRRINLLSKWTIATEIPGYDCIPLATNADAEHLYHRLTGIRHPKLMGTPSAAYIDVISSIYR
jgi:hypothetical protein